MAKTNDVLNVTALTALRILQDAVVRGARVEWFPNGDTTFSKTCDGVARSFAHEHGGFLNDNDDVRDEYVHVSGIFEYWLPVRDVMSWIHDGVFVVVS